MPGRPAGPGGPPPTGTPPTGTPPAGGPHGPGGPGGRPPPFAAADVQAGTSGADTLTADGTHKVLDGGAGNDSLLGNASDNIILGGLGTDTLSGGAGADTLGGGPGADVLTGGSGADLFRGGPPGPPATPGTTPTLDLTALNRVTDFVSGVDKLGLGHAPATAANYVEVTAASASAALTAANAQFAGGAVEYVAIQVGADTYVFAEGHEGAAGNAIVLTGVSLSGIAYTDLV